MKINTLAVIAAAGLSLGMLALAPANAATSLSKAKKLCEVASAEKFPDAVDINVMKAETRSTNAMIWYTLRVKGQDGETKRVVCTVDRETDTPTVYPS
jgi:hypothetical protein